VVVGDDCRSSYAVTAQILVILPFEDSKEKQNHTAKQEDQREQHTESAADGSHQVAGFSGYKGFVIRVE